MIKEQYRQTVVDTTLNISNSKIESVRNKNITKTSQRVYADGYIGVAGAIGAASEESLVREAVEALQRKIEYPAAPSGPKEMAIEKKQSILPASRFVDEIAALLESMRERQPGFIFSNKASMTEMQVCIKNDLGLNLSYAESHVSLSLLFKEKSSTSVFDGFVGFRERTYDRSLILEEFDLILNAYSQKADFPGNGRYPVVFLMEEAPVEKLITDLKADVLAKGGSLFSGRLGQKLFHKTFTFGQCLNPERAFGMPFFDAEGIVNPDYTYNLIENGVLINPYCDKRSAHLYGYTPSGSATAAYDGVPQTALLSPYVKNSGKSLKSLLGGQKGILVLMASGGDFTPNGDYATPVQLSMLFDGDKLLGRLPELNISSNVYDLFGEGFRGVADSFLPFTKDEYAVVEMNVSKL